jgi:Na+/H+ antiporter NhaB
MQNLGYHFCQIVQNMTPILKPVILSSLITCTFLKVLPICFIQI